MSCPVDDGLLGDFDGDGDIDQYDFVALKICHSFSGPGVGIPAACQRFNFDGDGDVDLQDIAEFGQRFTASIGGIQVEAGNLRPVPASPDGYYSGKPGTPDNNALKGIARQAGYLESDLWYEWSSPEPGFVISNPSFPSTSYWAIPPLAPGDYVFSLRVTNLVTLEHASDTVVLRVRCLQGEDCQDGDLCTDDSCEAGACVNNPVICDQGETCDPATGNCGAIVCASAGDCDDGFSCTDDNCVDEECVYTPIDARCANNLFCDGPDATCDPEDVNADVAGCVRTNPCDPEGTDPICYEANDECAGCSSDADCDDGIACTIDGCENDGSCTNDPNDGFCDDELFCTGAEFCLPGSGGADANGCISAGDPCLCPVGVVAGGCTIDAGPEVVSTQLDPGQALVCNESASRCDFCVTDGDCDDDIDCTANACLVTDGICDFTANNNACDGDRDGDGEVDETDNCPDDANPGQEDADNDGVGDDCDNCPDDDNPNQEDADQDGVGDACDGGGDPGPPVELNAGPNQDGVVPCETVTLDATAITPANATLTWRQIAGPSVGIGNSAPDPVVFSAPAPQGLPVVLRFQVTGTASGFSSGFGIVSVTVVDFDVEADFGDDPDTMMPLDPTRSSGAAVPGEVVTLTLDDDLRDDWDATWAQDPGDAMQVTLTKTTSDNATFVAPNVATTTTLNFLAGICSADFPGEGTLDATESVRIEVAEVDFEFAPTDEFANCACVELSQFATVTGGPPNFTLLFFADSQQNGVSIDQDAGTMQLSGAVGPVTITVDVIGTAAAPLAMDSDVFTTRAAQNVDTDNDGIRDECDNCPNVSNADQTDTDGDCIGDACEPQGVPRPLPLVARSWDPRSTIASNVSGSSDFEYTAPGGNIRDDNSTVFPLFMDSDADPEILTLELEIMGLSHTTPWDLDIYLFDPFGNLVAVGHDRGNQSPIADLNIIFNDSGAVLPLDPDTPLSSGAWQPEGASFIPTFQFRGTNAWLLLVTDDTAGQAGSFDSWTLRGTVVGP